MPSVLSEPDVVLYREIFALGDEGAWQSVDRLVDQLGDRLLLGHVLAQRYLHLSAYRSQIDELAAWLETYADHPDAGQIRELIEDKRAAEARARARSRRPEPAARPREVRAPVARPMPVVGRPSISVPKKRENAGRRPFASLDPATRAATARGWPALDMVAAGDGTAPVPGLMVAGWTDASFVARPRATWNSAIAAWQTGDFAQAAMLFEAVAENANSSWSTAAAAFWAARAHLHARSPEHVNRWLMVAAAHPRTFYGLLAGRILGLEMTFRWTPDEADIAAVQALAATPAGKRALALIQVGQMERAESELEMACCGRRSGHIHGAMVIAEEAGLAHLALRLSTELYPDGGGLDAAAYPIPYWQPDGGFSNDPALLYALARRESRFDPRAVSPAGARGLMQVMPGTADLVSRRSGAWFGGRKRLHEPTINMAIGQRYIEMLLTDEGVGNDLFRLTAAWNGGPYNLKKWEAGQAATDDSLLFIETIPYGETRDFIEHVLANYWIYRNRLGLNAPSLDALAAGAWPVYLEQQDGPVNLAHTYED